MRGFEEVEHLRPNTGPAIMEGAGRLALAALTQNAVPFLHELLDRFEQFVEVEFRCRASETEATPRALSRLDETRPSELAKELGQVVRGSLDPLRDISRVREGAGSQGG